MTIDEFLDRLHGVRKSESGKNWSSRCPGHDDAHNSLSVGLGEAGQFLVYCHAGCHRDAILQSLNLTTRDLFPADDGEGRRNGHPGSAQRSIIATYPYRDEAATLLSETVRFEPKDFKQRRPDGRGGWIWNLEGVRRVLYRLPELRGEPTVYVVEGEKDADRLASLGFAATTSPMGAGKWREEYVGQLTEAGCVQVVVIEDHDEVGHKHALDVVASCRRANLAVKHISLPWPFPRRAKGGEDVSDWLEHHPADELRAVITRTPLALDPARDPAHAKPARGGIWAQAVPVSELLNMTDSEVSWLEEHVVAPGSITELFSPRGLGKTHVAYAIAVKLAQRATRVLLLDRDNSKREVKRRLTAWGAAGLTTFKVMLRDQVPPLTDAAAWDTFPFHDWDLLIIDSLDAATEGVGEKDSAKPSKAIAPMLDIAHRADGPAILVLGNTIKSGEHSRGSGVVEDRGDISYEVRDATDLKPSGTKDWWLELPQAGAGAWAERASRRKRRDSYRLAFVPSKFRIGEEPEPFVYEINLALEPWSLRLVTAEIVQAGREARAEVERERAERQDRAAEGLLAALSARVAAGKPMTKDEATAYLKTDHQLKRQEARSLLEARTGALWESREDPTLRGKPKLWYPIPRDGGSVKNDSAAEIPRQESGSLTGFPASPISADRMDRARQKYPLAETRMNGGDSETPISAAESEKIGAPEPGEERL